MLSHSKQAGKGLNALPYLSQDIVEYALCSCFKCFSMTALSGHPNRKWRQRQRAERKSSFNQFSDLLHGDGVCILQDLRICAVSYPKGK